MFVLFPSIFYLMILESAALNVKGVQNRIYKGAEAIDGQFPFMVFILTAMTQENQSSCTGSLIKLDTVLTAAHCLHNEHPYIDFKPIDIVVAVGMAELDEFAEFRIDHPMSMKYPDHRGMLQEAIASQLFMHPLYKNNDDFDVGIIKIAKPFVLSRFVNTIKYTIKEYTGGTSCYILGYGLNHEEFVGKLYFYTSQKVMNNMNKCGKRPNPLLYCEVVESKSKPGGCQGDSGGPLLCKGKVYGVYQSDIPFDKNIDECGQPGIKVFTKLAASEKAQSFVAKFAELLESKSCTNNVPLPYVFLLLNILLLLYNKFES